MMNRNLLLTVAALFAIGASGANAAQVDFHPVQTEKFDKKEVSSYQTGGSGRAAGFDKTETTIGSATGGAGAGKTKARKSMGWDVIPQHCRGLACANGEH
jgi:hypothetical protein